MTFVYNYNVKIPISNISDHPRCMHKYLPAIKITT